MRRIIPIAVAFLMISFFSNIANAQSNSRVGQNWCGSVFDDNQANQLDAFAEYYYHRGGKAHYATKTRALKYLPIKYHLVAKSDKTGRYPLSKALDDLCILNADMSHADIQVYLKGDIDMGINNDAWTNGTGGTATSNPSQYTLMPQLKNDQSALNVYQVQKIRNENSVLGVAVGSVFHMNGGVPNASSSMLLIKKGEGGKDQTFAHELAHNLSMPHTFYQWEQFNDPSVPNSNYDCGTKAYSGAEKYDGSNCSTTGDRFCDTSPDYMFGGFRCGSNDHPDPQFSSCIQMDQDSTTGVADGGNIMSYGFSCTNRKFSTAQINMMDHNLATLRPSLISYTPNTTAITDPVTNATADNWYYDNVVLSWDPVPNATHYAIEISWLSTFGESFMKDMVVVTGTTYTSTVLTKNRNHFWRVIPFNEGYLCASPSTPKTFMTSNTAVATKNVEEINDLSINPNLANKGRAVNLVMHANKGFDADINIVDVQGRVVLSEPQKRFDQGENNYRIETSNLSAGIYIVTIRTETGVLNRKLVVTH